MAREILIPANNWRPRPYQMQAWKALRDPRLTNFVLAWHRRAGKDDVSLHDTAVRAMSRVGNYWHCMPQYSQCRKAIWEGINPHTNRLRWQDAFPPEIVKKVDNQSMRLEFVNGSSWQLVGSDTIDSLVGSAPVHVVMSEAALAKPEAFGLIRPILAENNGTMVSISSVRGRNHFYGMFKDAESDDYSFAQLLSADTSGVFTPEQLQRELRAYISTYGEAIGRALFEQEYLSSWDSAVIGSVFGREIKAMRDEGRVAPYPYDRRYPVITAWDLGVADETVIIFAQEIGGEIRIIDWFSDNGVGLDYYANVVHEKPYVYSMHFAPHDIAQREFSTGISRMSTARQLGLNFTRVPQTNKHEQIAAASDMLTRTTFHVDEALGDDKDPMDDCEWLLNALTEYHFAFDKTKRIMSKNPVHDWSSHYADAFMTLACGLAASGTHKTRRDAAGKTIEQTMRVRDILARQKAVQRRRGGAWG